ncbi:MAG: cation diffusion facilitator family transporter [Devosia sp.]|nr:cation diffusion facilitator family transporter [Devosia sp.]
MSHTHDHDHGHVHAHEGHVHAPASFGRAFAIGIALNTAFVVIEFVFGFLGNSVALMADAGHNLGDVLGLLVAWAATVLVKRAPSTRFTYGLRGSSILAALFNAVLLLLAVGAISLEAVQRLGHPEPVAAGTVMIVAAIGIAVNGATAMLFASGSRGDLNIRGAFTHMAADALVSVGVVVAGLVILVTGWLWLDPVVSLLINVVIIWGTLGLLRGSVRMSLAAVPEEIDPEAVRTFLGQQPGVASVHDLHIWSMSTTETAMTAHLVMPAGPPGDAFLHHICDELERDFGIGHATVQIETGPAEACALAPDGVV